MFDYREFQQVFPAGAQLPYDPELQAEIENSRNIFGGVLFIDRVMNTLGLSKGKLYPPKSDSALRNLHKQICDATMSLHHKYSLLYYLLLDFDESDAQTLASDGFATASGMPKNYQTLMKGLWYLDQQMFPKALENIAHPSLIPDFADEIITALVTLKHDDLALAYYYSVQPILKTLSALELLFGAMARTNVTEALFFTRTQSDHTREVLFRRLVSVALDHKQSDSAVASELAFLPFESEEEAWFEDHLHGDGKNLKRAKDTLLIRKIAGDRFNEVSRLRSGGQWGPVLEGIKAGTEGQDE